MMGKVFRFTFMQNTKGKGFVFITFIVPVIICAICILADVIAASGDSSETYNPVEKVYVTNNSDLSYVDFGGFRQYAGEEYDNVEFIMDAKAPENELNSLDMTIEENDEEYAVKVHIPDWSEITYGEAKDFNNIAAGYVEKLRTIDAAMKSGGNNVSESDIMKALIPVQVEFTTIGDEDAGLGAELIKMILPMFMVLFLYFIVIIYGQSIGKIIISEKVSKLMETLLINVRPYQLISGKILAMTLIAALQIVMWFTGIVAGLIIGDMAAKSIEPEFSNVIFNAMDLIRDGSVGMAFSIPALILSVIAIIIGFVFYCVIAALFASPVSKAEELATSTGIFQTIVIISFLAAYMLPLQGINSQAIDIALHVIPVTSAFMLSGDILIGNISIIAGAGYMALLVIFTAGIAIYAGKLYRNQVFYYSARGSFAKRLFR